MATPIKLPAQASRWIDRLFNLAMVVAVAVLLYRWVLPRGSAPLGDLALTQALPPGRPTVVELSATYCPTCVAMRPIMALLAHRYGDRATIETLEIDRPSDHDAAVRLSELARLRVTPTVLVVNAQGRAVAKFIGPTSYAALATALDSTLKQPKSK